MSNAELERVLSQNFDVRRNVNQLPYAVKQLLSNLTEEPFEMVNPGQAFSTALIIPGLRNKQLLRADLAAGSAVVVYEVGGYATVPYISVFDFQRGKLWADTLDNFCKSRLGTSRYCAELRI